MGFVEVICDSLEKCQQKGLRSRFEMSTDLIHITSSPSFSNGEVNWQIISLEIAPAPRSIVPCPVVVQATVEGGLIIHITVVSGYHTLDGVRPVSALVAKVPGEEGRGSIGEVRVDFSK